MSRLVKWFLRLLAAVALVAAEVIPAPAATAFRPPYDDVFPTCTSACTTTMSKVISIRKLPMTIALYFVGSGTWSVSFQRCLERSPDVCTTNNTWMTIGSAVTATGVQFYEGSGSLGVGYYRIAVGSFTSGMVRVFAAVGGQEQ